MMASRTFLVVLLLTAPLAGCSNDPYESYCESVSDHQRELTELLAPRGPDALLKALPVFRDLQDQAPPDIRDDWQIVVTGLSALDEAITAAGLDAANYDSENPPADLSTEDRERIEAAAARLTRPDSVAAFGAVEQQARDVCKTPLYL
ncbi:hypothetical protein [Nocardioides sp.]|uniref:hypothetical protein n=1 Tax=Nocardioides sp. TaxID=35761 RepID=UPI00356434F4